MKGSATRDDLPLRPEQIATYAQNGTACPARFVRSMAQELQRRREWDAPPPVFHVTKAEQKIIEGFRLLVASKGEKG